MKSKLLLLIIFLLSSISYSQQLISASSVSNKTILLKFDEGEKDLTNFDQYYIYDAPNATYYGQINEAQALITTNFIITSTDDANYGLPQNPIATYFKSKEQKGLFEYYVYLELPMPMLGDAEYNIAVSNINAEELSYTVSFDVFNNFSESLHVNQIGMIASSGEKYAYISQWLGKNANQISNSEDFSSLEGAACHVVKVSDGSIIYTGSGVDGLRFRNGDLPTNFDPVLANEYWTRSSVWDFDFSEVGNSIPVEENEEYKIVVEGVGSSYPFRFSEKLYEDVFNLIAKGLYHQRSGIDRKQPYSNLLKPIDHIPGASGFEITYTDFRRLDNTGGDAESFVELPLQATNFINPTNAAPWMSTPDNFPWGSGGHFDAGDHDIYTQHLVLPLYVTFAYLMAPQGFYDGQFNIPENNNGIPDILDEVRWTLDFFRRTKGATGGVCGGKETTGYYAPSWNNGSGTSSSEQMWYVYKEDPLTSYIYAAAAAQFALALQISGDVTNEADIYISDAIAAYNWAKNNAIAGDTDKVISGFPTSGKFPDARLMAASMLYSVTGNQEYLDFYIANTNINASTSILYDYQVRDEQFATYAFTLIPQNKWSNFNAVAQNLQDIQKQASINWAYTWGLNDQDSFPFRNISSQYDPPLGGNTASTPTVFPQIVAYHLSQDTIILDKILVSNDMNFGANSNNWVYVTGADMIGAERFSTDILHNDNYEYGGDNIPGLPLYGLTPTSQYYFQSSPPAEEWPHYECNSNARIYLGHAEFTIHQNSAPSLAVFGYLNAMINPDYTLSVDSLDDTFQDISVYPNPSNGSFSVNSFQEIIDLKLFDVNGRLIPLSNSSINSKEFRIHTDNINSGIYFLRLHSYSGTTTKKVVIARN